MKRLNGYCIIDDYKRIEKWKSIPGDYCVVGMQAKKQIIYLKYKTL